MSKSQTAPAPSRTEPMRYGLIGCGDIGVVRAAAIAQKGARLVAVNDIDAGKAAALAAGHGAAVDRDWRDLIARDLDAVIVSTPPSLHEEMCVAALRAGRHVLCEKPLARDADECRRMLEAADAAGRVLAVGFNYRFYPSFARAREILDSGAIGELSHIRAYAGYSATGHGQAWVKDASVVGGGTLHDNGIHLIDLTRWFLGEVADVHGLATSAVWRYGAAEDNGFLIMRNPEGRVATLHASWTEWGKYQFRIELVGTLGRITATCFPMHLEVLTADRTGGRMRRRTERFIRTTIGEHLKSYRWVVAESFVREYDAFERAIAGQPSPIAAGLDGLRAIEIARSAAHIDPPATAPGPAGTGASERSVTTRDAGPVAAGPPLSVVVIMFTGQDALVRCLDALHAQSGVGPPEILVPCDDALSDTSSLEARFPGVSFLHIPGSHSPAELRAVAVARASGRVVALVEDHCMPDPDWCARILEAHRAGHAAVGGSVEKGFAPGTDRDSALDWAVYMTDYSRYMNPIPEGPATSLTDCNVTYKREALEPIRHLWAQAFHENVVNGALASAGRSLWLDPRIVVRNFRPLTVSKAVRDRYAFGRLFAATRVEGQSLVKRLIYAGASVIMPPVLAVRAARNLTSRKRHQEQVLRCAPALLLVASTWMLGEMVGYLTGSAGALRPRLPAAGIEATTS